MLHIGFLLTGSNEMPPKFKFTKEEIVNSAFAIVRNKGWTGLTTRALADQLGASARPIYSYFQAMKDMEEEVVKRGVDLLYDYMVRKRTDDQWHDHGIGYVMFAREEKHLFRCMNDENHIIFFKKYGDVIWDTLTSSLDSYEPFKGLSGEEILKVQVTRWLFTHGLAFQVNNPPPNIWDKQIIISTIQEGSNAILDGLKSKFAKGKNSKDKEDDMSKRDPKKMAAQIAGVRAAETHLPENERVFQDPYAEYFLNEEDRNDLSNIEKLRAGLAMYDQMMPGVNGAIVARIRYIDECLLDCIKLDFKQLVIIGAGYDTRAYRFPEVKDNLKVFEVDHPETQKVKISKIKEIFGTLPDHVSYVPVVFGVDRLDKNLLENGYDPTTKTLFVVEGLLMYVPPMAVDGLLSFIVNASGPGSSLVADCFSDSVIKGTSPLKEAQALRQFVESEGAPLQFGVEEKNIIAFFKERGFQTVTNVPAESCREKYFKNKSYDRTISQMFNFVFATVQSNTTR
jgi:methyltransferase (TIGR00027 family)